MGLSFRKIFVLCISIITGAELLDTASIAETCFGSAVRCNFVINCAFSLPLTRLSKETVFKTPSSDDIFLGIWSQNWCNAIPPSSWQTNLTKRNTKYYIEGYRWYFPTKNNIWTTFIYFGQILLSFVVLFSRRKKMCFTLKSRQARFF